MTIGFSSRYQPLPPLEPRSIAEIHLVIAPDLLQPRLSRGSYFAYQFAVGHASDGKQRNPGQWPWGICLDKGRFIANRSRLHQFGFNSSSPQPSCLPLLS